jgi:hypothetical protein
MMIFRRRESPAAPSPKIEQLTGREVEWRDNQLEIARLLAERYVGQTSGLPDIAALDDVIDGWLDDDESRVEINIVINGVGTALGQHVANATDLAWVIATDDHGSDLALHGQPGDIVIFPANATAKRVSAGERRFVGALIAQLVGGVQERRLGG